MNNKSHLTAISRPKPSAPATHAYENIIKPNKFNSVLDWGCGKGTDVNFFKEMGLRSFGYDPYYANEKPKRGTKYDCIVVTYVINTIESKQDRIKCLQEARKFLRRNGRLVISVRSESEIAYESEQSEWKEKGDGCITGSGSFQKGFSITELVDLAKKAGITPITCGKVNSTIVLVAGK